VSPNLALDIRPGDAVIYPLKRSVQMFSDKLRLLKIFAVLAILSFLVLLAVLRGPGIYPGYSEALEEPAKYGGQKIYFSGDIINIDEKYFSVLWNKRTVKVLGSLEKDKKDYHISGAAIFNEDLSLTLLNYHTSRLIRYKVFLSIIPLLVVFYLFFKEYTFRLKNMMFQKRT
jgi:hypothetical protein